MRVRPAKMALVPACLTKDYKSAPEKPSNFSSAAIFAISIAFLSICTLLQILLRIDSLSSALGIGTHTCFSSLPERSTAGSIMSGLFVAAITKTPRFDV